MHQEPPNGAFALVGTNPYDILATRADKGDLPVGQWWLVAGEPVESLPWPSMLTYAASQDLSSVAVDAESVAVRRLYSPGQAVAELILGPAIACYQRYSVAASSTNDREETRHRAQQAMAIRGFVEDLCAAHDVPPPNWSPDPEGGDQPAPADPRHLIVVPDRPGDGPGEPRADVVPAPAVAPAAGLTLVPGAADDTADLPSLRFPAGPDHLPEQTDPVLQPPSLWERLTNRASPRGRHSAQGRRTGGAA